MKDHKQPGSVANGRTPGSRQNVSAATVYIVDPDETVRAGLEKLFRFGKLQVRSFTCAEDFLDGYKGNGVGCLLLEMDLPGINGLDLQAVLSRRRIALPVIALSGQGNVPIAVRALHAGAIDFIEKPYLPQLLVRRVREAIRQVREVSATPSDLGTPT